MPKPAIITRIGYFRGMYYKLKTLITGCVSIILFNSSEVCSQPFVKMWDQTFGGSKDDAVNCFILNTDKGYVIGGSSLSGITGEKTQPNWDPTLQTQDFWIIRTDSNGVKIWDKRFGGTSAEELKEVILTNDGALVAAGVSYSGQTGDISEPNRDPNQGSQDYWMIKFDQSGNKLWDKRFGGILFELFESVKQSPDGSYYLGGSSLSPVSGDKTVANWGGWDFWIVKTDSLGNKLWDKRYGGTSDDMFTNLVATQDGGALLGGYTKSGIGGNHSQINQGAFDYWIVRIDAFGNVLWERNFGGNYNDWLFSVIPLSTGEFLLGGQSFSEQSGDKSEPNHDPNPSGSDYWVIKVDENGNKIWDRTIGADMVEALSHLAETPAGNYMLSGESYSGSNGDKTEANLGIEQTWVVTIDTSGAVLWDKTILTNGHDELGTAIPVNDLCFTVVNYTAADTGGYKSSMTRGDGDYWMVKLCDITVGINENLNASYINLYPNPASDQIRILNREEKIRTGTPYQIIDMRGLMVHEGEIDGRPAIDISKLKDGMYLFRIYVNDRWLVKKFLILK